MTATAAFLGPTGPTSRARKDARDQIVAAARELFLSAGVRRTTMEHVARRVGTSRQTVYKLFLGRTELVEAALVARIEEMADALADDWSDGDLIETFVRTSVRLVETLRDDGELRVLIGEGSPITLHEAVWMDSVRERSVRFWRPWIARARSDGLLRDDLQDEAISDWLETVYGSLVLRAPMDSADLRELVERFVVPSVLQAGPATPAGGRPT